MSWIIISFIVTIGLFIGLGFKEIEVERENGYGYKKICKEVKWLINKVQFLSILGLLITLPSFISSVPANSVGILYSPFSGVSETTLGEGFHIKNPLSKVYKISTEVQTKRLENVYTQTNDSQYIVSAIDVKYAVDKANAYLIFKQFRTLDNMSTTLISPTIQRTMELITTQYNVIDILGDKRNVMYSQLQTDLAEELSKYGITFYSVTITDTDAGEAIEKAIEAEAVAKKAVETAEQEYLKVQTEAKQKTVAAQAEQDAAKIKAETLIIQAQSEKEANELLTKSLTNAVLYKMWIEKWDGQLSKVASGDSGVMIDIGNLVD